MTEQTQPEMYPDGFEHEVLDLMNAIDFERQIEEVVSDFIRKETLDINNAEDEKKIKAYRSIAELTLKHQVEMVILKHHEQKLAKELRFLQEGTEVLDLQQEQIKIGAEMLIEYIETLRIFK
jgi:hypothetical protein